MIGIVVVSHSTKLAEGVVELAQGMAGSEVKIMAAGGLDMSAEILGTDPLKVMRAVEEVYSEDGVIVLMDLGSAILSAEMALDLLPPEYRSHVRLCEAPLVEGTVAAVVQARLGGTLEQVFAEARGALAAKAVALTGAAPEQAPSNVQPVETIPQASESVRLLVKNALGLHARPAARFVQTASRFAAEMSVQNVTNGRGPVNAKSINGVATLGARQNCEIDQCFSPARQVWFYLQSARQPAVRIKLKRKPF